MFERNCRKAETSKTFHISIYFILSVERVRNFGIYEKIFEFQSVRGRARGREGEREKFGVRLCSSFIQWELLKN